MSNADDDSGSGTHEDELHDLITLLDDLMEDLEARVQMDFDDDIRGSTRVFLTTVVLPAVQEVLETCTDRPFVRYARKYIAERRQDPLLEQPDTVLRTRDELTPLRQVLKALRGEQSRRTGGASSDAPRHTRPYGTTSPVPDDGPGQSRYRGAPKIRSAEPGQMVFERTV